MSAVLFLLVSIAVCCFGEDIEDCGFHSCQELKHAKPETGSGEYWFSNGNGGLYRAYCEYRRDYGYMFFSKLDANVSINFKLIHHSKSEVLVRHLRSDDRQYDTTMGQIKDYSTHTLSVQYNANSGYATPVNHNTMGPYIYLGFLCKNHAANKNTQGYKANGKDFTFRNCDANPNSYLAFYYNKKHGLPNGYYKKCCYSGLMRDWINVARPAASYLPCEYFFQFEMHMGGCGGYAVNRYNSLNDIWGAALGLRFDVYPSTSEE